MEYNRVPLKRVGELKAMSSTEFEHMRQDAERYRFMRKNIDYTDNGDGTGFYWHNQRGEFSFEYRDDPDGAFRPTFESVIDEAMKPNVNSATPPVR